MNGPNFPPLRLSLLPRKAITHPKRGMHSIRLAPSQTLGFTKGKGAGFSSAQQDLSASFVDVNGIQVVTSRFLL
jgi:hypothetical protein